MRSRTLLRPALFFAGFAFAGALAMPATALAEAAADQSPLCDAARDECARGGDCNAYMCYCFGGPFCLPLG